jgi:hypothetical protein
MQFVSEPIRKVYSMDTMDTHKIRSDLHQLETQLGILARTASGSDAASREVHQLTAHVLRVVGILGDLVRELKAG